MAKTKTVARRVKSKTASITKSPKEWTIMVYLAGDNNLSEEMITALLGIKNAMSISNSDNRVNVLAVYDSGYPTVPTTHYRFTNANSNGTLSDCKIEYVHPQIRFRDRDQPPERAYIIDFVRWTAEKFPAMNYALIMSGHSDGFIGKTLFRDTNPSTALNLSKLKYILKRSQGHLKTAEKFALIGFDSCLMNMAEVGYELQDITDVLVASEGNVPTSGWSYYEIIGAILASKKGTFTAKEFARATVDKFIDFSRDYNAGGRSVNISAADLTKAADLARSINALAKLFNQILALPIGEKESEGDNNALLIEKLKNLIHNSHYYSQTFMFEQAVDVLDFVNTLASNCDLEKKENELLFGKSGTPVARRFDRYLAQIKAKCTDVATLVDEYVLANGFSGAEYRFSSGVSVFFPWTLIGLYLVYSRYSKLRFSNGGNGSWFAFIERFNELTYRGIGEPLSKTNLNFAEWRRLVAQQLKNTGAKNTGAKNTGAKNTGAKNTGAKNTGAKNTGAKNTGAKNTGAKNLEARTTETDGFYSFFARFRNHPIDHDVVGKTIH